MIHGKPDGPFGIAFLKAAVTEKVMNGFINTGICPLNEDVCTEKTFLLLFLK
jgi:hypothetical protein